MNHRERITKNESQRTNHRERITEEFRLSREKRKKIYQKLRNIENRNLEYGDLTDEI